MSFSLKLTNVLNQLSKDPACCGTVSIIAAASGGEEIAKNIVATGINATTVMGSGTGSIDEKGNILPGIAGVTYGMVLKFDHKIPVNGYIVVQTISAVLALSTASGCNAAGFTHAYLNTCTTVNTDDFKTIAGSEVPAGTSLTFDVTSFTTPSLPTSTSFIATTYDVADHEIDQISAGIIPDLKCSHPCENCDTATPAICTDCYSTPILPNFEYLKSDDDTCISQTTCTGLTNPYYAYYANAAPTPLCT
jgi:hypothetical protein